MLKDYVKLIGWDAPVWEKMLSQIVDVVGIVKDTIITIVIRSFFVLLVILFYI